MITCRSSRCLLTSSSWKSVTNQLSNNSKHNLSCNLLPLLPLICESKRNSSSKRPKVADGSPPPAEEKVTSATTAERPSSPSPTQIKEVEDRQTYVFFGPKDLRAPLPGNVGLEETFDKNSPFYRGIRRLRASRSDGEYFRVMKIKTFLNPTLEDPDVVTSELNIERQVRAIYQLTSPVIPEIISTMEEVEQEKRKILKAQDKLEVIAHPCPYLLAKDFQELYPSRNFTLSHLTVLTLCYKTQNDMSFWTDEMGKEREQLMKSFIKIAKAIVDKLEDDEFWADFIDPFSGRPMSAPYVPSTFFETDSRYRKFGFQIEDVGCCQVIKHHAWGTKAFVGSIFTNAPHDSIEVEEIIDGQFDLDTVVYL